MKPKILFGLFLLCAASLAALYPALQTKPREAPRASAANQPRIVQAYGKLPLAFEANRGQTDGQVKFISRGHGYTMFLTGDEAVLSLRSQKSGVRSQSARTPDIGLRTPGPMFRQLIQNPSSRIQNLSVPNPGSGTPSTVRLKLVGANPQAKVAGFDELPGKSNYFIGNDPKKWRTNVPNFAKVKYQAIYPGIDLVYYGNQGSLEHDFVVSPGVDPGIIKLAIEGSDGLRVDPQGNLVANLDDGEVRLNKPIVYQHTVADPKSQIANPKSIDGRYVLLADNRVGFEVGAYDRDRPLVIDPVLSYATYLGGSNADYGLGIAVDGDKNAYVTGITNSPDFPVGSGYDQQCGTDSSCNYVSDVFLTKINHEGSAILFSTYLGGSSDDSGFGVVLDNTGAIYLAGTTVSNDFPTKAGAFQETSPGPQPGFVTKLAAAGDALLYSTYLGGEIGELLYALAVDSDGHVYVTGGTVSYQFPVENPIQPEFSGGMACGDFFGYYDCPDAFIAELTPDLSGLVYSTYLGRTGVEYGTSIQVDPSGNAYVGGYTTSSDFPHTVGSYGGGYDAFVLTLTPDGQTIGFSALLGGSDTEFLQTLVLDSQNNICITGGTASTDFPKLDPFQPDNAAPGTFDAFVTKMDSSGNLVFSTYLGGTGGDIGLVVDVDSDRNIYVMGQTYSSDFPHVNPIQANLNGSSDFFITKFGPSGGAPLFSTFLGGSADEGWYGGSIAVDDSGSMYITGDTASPDIAPDSQLQPIFGGGGLDAFVGKISPSVGPGLSLTPESLNFADQLVNTTSSEQTITVTNTGDLDLPISFPDPDSTGDFTWTHSCTSPLPVSASCSIVVTFSPTATGPRDSTLTLTYNTDSQVNIELKGKGTDFAVSIPSGEDSKTVNAGATATYNLQIAPTDFSGTVALACAFEGSTPRGAGCSVSPSSVTLNGTDPAAFAVNVTTTARSTAGPRGPALPLLPAPQARHTMPLCMGLILLILSAAAAVCGRRCLPGRTPALQWAPLATTLLVALLWVACGGGSNPPTPSKGTPAGTYSLTVTATSSGVSKPSTLTLKVN
jgi:hypothetical protein